MFFLGFLQNTIYSAEYISIMMILLCSFLILLSLRILGVMGLYIYNVVAIIASNIQVLQVSNFAILEEPIALGSITFATTFLVSDIISENFGKSAAQKGIAISFLAQGIFTLMMLSSSLYLPAEGYEKTSEAVDILFIPSWRILFASIFSYYVSQYLDIGIFKGLKDATYGKFLWLRTIVSTALSGFIDNFIFSYLAWILLSSDPITMKSLFLTYVIGAYIGRLFVNIVTMPIIYLSRYCVN